MATFANVTGATAPTFAPPGVGSLAVVENRIAVATGDLTLNTVIPIGRVPRGALVHDVIVSGTDMDTSGAPALAFHVGDAGDNDRFITALSATAAFTGRAGNAAGSAATLAAHTPYTAETLISLTVSTAAATAAAGTIKATIIYSIPAA